MLEESGLGNASFEPFSIQIDLPRPEISGPIYTYTVRTDEGDRLQFRGTLFQPWCHLVANKLLESGE